MIQRIKAEVELIRGDAGTWLLVTASDGRYAMFSLENITTSAGIRAAVLHWADELFNKAAI